MKRFYSLVLMAVALLVGTNAWAAQVRTVSTAGEFETAWKALQNGDEIRLMDTVSIGRTLWLGTTTMADANPMSITLNLNGYKLIGTATKMFIITHGELNVVSNNGEGTIEHTAGQGQMSSTYEIFRVLGSTYKDVDPKNLGENQKYYSHLVIGENVKLIASNNAVVVDQANTVYPTSSNAWAAGNVTIPSTDAAKQKLYTNVYRSDRGVANGVCIDVKGKIEAQKYAIKANGNLGVPANHTDATYPLSYHFQDRNNTAYEIVEGEQNVYSPFIHIHGTAELLTKNFTSTAAIAAYSGGYSRWLVEGTCIGSTGVYVKSGELVINNATVASNYTGTYQPAGESERSSGVDAGGSGIVMETAKAYAGEMDVTVQGDTKVSGTVGYAIDEAVSPQSDSTKVDAITITGGTFESGDQGTMRVTEITAEANLDPTQETIITIIGGSADNTSTTIGNQSLVEFLSDQAQEPGKETHITYVENEEGKTVMVISQGIEPLANNKVSDASTDASIKWQGTIVKDTINSNLRLAELEINDTITAAEALANPSLTAGDPRTQILVINSGKTLEVGRVILGKGAQIIVEAGGKFIVTGEQGIVAPVTSNIILKASESEQAYFLFNPAVTSNRHPNATVQLISKSFYEGGVEVDQRFGMPTYDGKVTLTPVNPGTVQTFIKTWDYAADDWSAWSNITSGASYTDAEPFRGYMLASNNAKASPMTYELKGALVGNGNTNIHFRYGWNNLANSYSAPIDIYDFMSKIAASGKNINATAYLYFDLGNDTYTWTAMNLGTIGAAFMELVNGTPVVGSYPTVIKPMQAFLMQFRTIGETADHAVNYATSVYNPALGIANNAPARNRQNTNKMQIAVYNADVIDNVMLIEDAQFSNELDNGYDAVKYENTSAINLYAMNNENRMSILATDNIDGTFIGVHVKTAGNYFMHIYGVNGMEYAIVDMLTGKTVKVMEGEKYNFYAEAGDNDYRFQIVEVSKVATDIENAEVNTSVKGIYSITGMYLGENFDVLPKGAYIVNGVKVIK